MKYIYVNIKHYDIAKLVTLCMVLLSYSLVLRGQVVENSYKKSSDLKPKLLGENLIIIDNSTGHIMPDPALDKFREAADSLGQTFGFQTIFQGMYLHLGSQPEELRTSIQDYNLANLNGVDPTRPSIALFARHILEGEESTILEDRVDWTGYVDLDSLSEAKKYTIRGLAIAAAEDILEQSASSLEEAGEAYLEAFLQALRDPPRHYFLIKKKFYGPDSILYLPRSDFALPIKLIREEDYENRDTTMPVLQYVWKKRSGLISDNGQLLPEKTGGTEAGKQIVATFADRAEAAATSIVVVEVSIDQKPSAAAYSIDDNEIDAYPTHNISRINNNIAPYKCIAQGKMEEIPIKLKPRGIPLEVVSITTPSEVDIQISVNDGDPSFTLDGNGNNLLTIKVDESEYKYIHVSNKPSITIPITFIRVATRFPNGFGSEKVEGPGKFEQAEATSAINQLNQIYRRVNVSFQLDRIEDIEETNDNNQFEYQGTRGISELVRIWNHANVRSAVARGTYPILVVKKLVNLDYNTTNNIISVPAGVTPTGSLVSTIALDYPNMNKLPLGQTAAHEIGHGYFSLLHPFDEFANQVVGADKYNLMDYKKPTTQKYFRGYQFNDIIYREIQ